MYERTRCVCVCRGTVNGSVPLHSTTLAEPKGNRTVRVEAPNRDAMRPPPSHATCPVRMTCAIDRRVPADTAVPATE